MIFGSSALVAIVLREPGWDVLVEKLSAGPDPTLVGVALLLVIAIAAALRAGDVSYQALIHLVLATLANHSSEKHLQGSL